MKTKLLLAAVSLFFGMALASYASMPAAKISAGEFASGEAASYIYGGRIYLNAAQASRALGGKTDFLPASGRLLLSAKGLKMLFSEKSDSVSVNGEKYDFPEPMIIRAGIPFILADCLSADSAAEAYGSRIAVDAAVAVSGDATGAAGLAEKPAAAASPQAAGGQPMASGITPQPSSADAARITSVRAADHGGKTRIVFQLDAPRNWTEQGSGKILNIGIPWTVPVLDNEPALKVSLASSVKISSDSYGTNARIELAEEAEDINVFALKEPDRIVIDIFDSPQPKDISEQQSHVTVSAGEIKTASAKTIVPMTSLLEESLDEPEDVSDEVFALPEPEEDDEDINSYPELKPVPEEDEKKEASSRLVPADNINNAGNTAQKKNSSQNAKVLKTKSRTGRTSKKAVSSKKAAANEVSMPASVMAGLKASGLDYAYAKNADHAKNNRSMPGKSVSRAVKQNINSSAPVLQEGKRIIVIDASHGGRDNGSRKKFGLYEKQYSLLLAREIKELFEGNEFFQAAITRNSDEFLPIKERSRISNELKASIFVSIHGNSSGSSSRSGFEVYSLSDIMSDSISADIAERENSATELESESERPSAVSLAKSAGTAFQEDSRSLAAIIASELARGTSLKNNGAKQGDFILLRLTEAPAVLVFAGYMTNTGDKKIMDDKHSRKRIARSIYNGIMAYAEMKGWNRK